MSLRKGPSGHLRQDPSEEGMRIKKNPSLQDKSAAQKHEHVRTNALTEVLQMGGQVSDRLEVEEEERGGPSTIKGRKDSLLWKNRETLSSMKMCLVQRLLSLWSHHTSLQPLSRAIVKMLPTGTAPTSRKYG
ncbi:Protein STICHEL-like 4 [Dissostichus eleginoides]|uniref:Protein STICHEL-like 4 n=1 Tax=Dissostichus eleginoides TaxID=100907 RepID=A0AAD9BFF3_DISEL|nr:Protein STICHEL-like 4 [Dissostichus eleginoides]